MKTLWRQRPFVSVKLFWNLNRNLVSENIRETEGGRVGVGLSGKRSGGGFLLAISCRDAEG